MIAITARQREILAWIFTSNADRGYPPTIREMMSAFGWASTNAAIWHLTRLSRKGFIARTDFKSRGYRLTESGRIAAGVVGGWHDRHGRSSYGR